MARWWNKTKKAVGNATIGEQARYNRLNAAVGATEDELSRLETGTGGTRGLLDLEHEHEEAVAKHAEAAAAHAEAKDAFTPIDIQQKKLQAEVTGAKTRLEALQKAHEAAEKAHADHQAKISDIESRVGSASVEDLAQARQDAEIARAQARHPLKKLETTLPGGSTGNIDEYFKNERERYKEAKRKIKSALGTPREETAIKEFNEARANLVEARKIRRGTEEYRVWSAANNEYLAAEALHEEAKALGGLRAKSDGLKKAADQAEAKLTGSPDHVKLKEAEAALETHTTEVHTPAANRLALAKEAVEGGSVTGTREAMKNAEHALKSTTRRQELLEGRLERQTKRLEQVGEKWRIGKSGKIVTGPMKFAGKTLKWGGLGVLAAGAGALAYNALKPSNRGSDEALQGLKDQIAENEAKLTAIQTMQPQQPVMQQPIMVAATPQGPVATQYPPVMMVPANSNVPATSITSAGLQYQGQLIANQGQMMGAPA
ncbi:MAG: hypothetical protein U1E36_05760 [Rickettsiales bacterium]